RLRSQLGARRGAVHGPDAVPGHAPLCAAPTRGPSPERAILGPLHAVRRELRPEAHERGGARGPPPLAVRGDLHAARDGSAAAELRRPAAGSARGGAPRRGGGADTVVRSVIASPSRRA